MSMQYEVLFFDENDECVEGYFFAPSDEQEIFYDAIARANDENVGYEYAELHELNDDRVLAVFRDGEIVEENW